ncbi:NeuD/PglB/VioB family sugar acetyltransferase [Chryseobacterium fluminis]|uniref:NeuD/PglB/VioB family sugar acetyltransferase n=1 Tax=Chryseobacterium fluminis TaxID=2983606 RepID=UPI00225972C7|nr:NeuD/PglB/VioB family sugar acetyltransferase [Chryseobacterium sp. MMS21-Ot14]UZT99688.1 NeuD/PglB/VioB family sugar acetyltransferase [Chryseobacterium sp. MMS21-Ot14]
MKKIAIIGAGGFGREVKMLIDQINHKENQFQLVGFYDDKHYENHINGVPYLGKIENINMINDPLCLAVAIADPKIKQRVLDKIDNVNIEYPNLIHPSVIIGQDNVKLGKGNIICAGVIITIDIEIEDFVILNLSCTVGHDTQIKKYCSFMPTVNISGEVIVNEAVYVGTGAKIINLLEIGENTIVGAGAVVSKSLPANCTAVGIPAKPIKFH